MIPPIQWVVIEGEPVPTDLVKIGEGGAECYVYAYTKDGWLLSDNKIVIPEGWIASPPPPKKEN